jgi:alkylation response protein AidB-like acyl-CoA dehydrogenase
MENLLAEERPKATSDAARKAALDVLVREVEARRNEFEKLTYVPRDVVALMKNAGIFRSSTPTRFGGDPMPAPEFLRVVERVSRADGSAGWVTAFGSSGTYLAALPLETQRKIYAEGPDQVFAGGLYPLQMAQPEKGGYRVSGRWRFASGCMGADWIGVGLRLPPSPDDPPRAGPPVPVLAVAPASEVEIIMNWNVVGMQGTGSHDTRVQDKFYPYEWTCERGSASLIDEPLFRYPALPLQAQVHAVVNVGLARAALDLLVDMAGGAKIIAGAPSLGDRAYYRTEWSRAQAKWQSLRLYFYDVAERAWAVVARGDVISPELEAEMRLSATYAAQSSAEVVQVAYRIAGMSAIEKTHRLQQIVRDSMVVTQHVAVNESNYDTVGGTLLGRTPAGKP